MVGKDVEWLAELLCCAHLFPVTSSFRPSSEANVSQVTTPQAAKGSHDVGWYGSTN